MDNLAMDVIRAEQDGYGTHYSKWKALHPNTEEENIPLIKAWEEEHQRKEQKAREPMPCPICGKVWQPRPGCLKYCSKECRKIAFERQEEERKRREVISRTVFTIECEWCGKMFHQKGGNHRKYCCQKCAKAAANFRAAERHRNARRAEG